MTSASAALEDAVLAALLASAPLKALLGGAHIFAELPRGANHSLVVLGETECRDWSVKDQKAHEHFLVVAVRTNSRRRKLAHDIVGEIETILDHGALALSGHVLVSLRLVFWSVARDRKDETFNATMRFRAATEPL